MATEGRVDLGAVSAYAVAVANGFVGTEAEWEQYIADASTNAMRAETARRGAESAVAHTPIIQSGTWWVYDFTNNIYVDTGYEARGEVGSEYTVMVQEGEPTEETNKLWVPLNEEQYTEVLTVGDLPANKKGKIFGTWGRRALGGAGNMNLCVCIDNGFYPEAGDYITIWSDTDIALYSSNLFIDFCSDEIPPETPSVPPESFIIGIHVAEGSLPNPIVAGRKYMLMYSASEGLVAAECYLCDPTVDRKIATVNAELATKANQADVNDRTIALSINTALASDSVTLRNPKVTADYHVLAIYHATDYDFEWETANGTVSITNTTTGGGIPVMTLLLGYFMDATDTITAIVEPESEEAGT